MHAKRTFAAKLLPTIETLEISSLMMDIFDVDGKGFFAAQRLLANVAHEIPSLLVNGSYMHLH